MADDQDQSQKTEEPTEKKLSDAHKKGDVAKSQEVNTWFVLAAGTLVVAFMSPTLMSGLAQVLKDFLSHPHAIPTEPAALGGVLRALSGQVLLIVAAPLAVILVAAVAGNTLQHKPVLTTERMKPKLDKISPLKGFKRLFGMSALVNFGKGLGKMAIVGAAAFVIVWPNRNQLANIISWEPVALLPYVRTLATQMLGGVIAVLTVIAALDFMYQKFQFTKRQRMTKQEVKDEHKQSEGDPAVKAKLRQVRMERGRKRMMAAVPEASVVITNPTHYAIALKYEGESMAAPVCVAKGVDRLALRIRTVAEENHVPVVENPPLARALYASVELDDEVPPEHYKAVAQVIGYVMRLKNRTARAGR